VYCSSWRRGKVRRVAAVVSHALLPTRHLRPPAER
jgi:hypothetical protein